MYMTNPTKKALKSIVVIVVTVALVALYVLPGLITPRHAPPYQTQTQQNSFTGPTGAPSVQGPSTPPGQ